MLDKDKLSLMADIAQLLSFAMNTQEVSNDEIFKHLLQQDKILDAQNQEFLAKIVQQNEEIIQKLSEIFDFLKNL